MNRNISFQDKRPAGKTAPIIHHVRTVLLAQEYRPGDRFLTDAEFAKRFDVSLLTANKLIAMLAAEGYFIRERGRGTFVTEKVLELSPVPVIHQEVDRYHFGILSSFDPAPSQQDQERNLVNASLWSHPLWVVQGIDLNMSLQGGRSTLFNQFPSKSIESKNLRAIEKSGVNGLIIMKPFLTEENIALLSKLQIPLVGADTSIRPFPVDTVTYDDFSIGFTAAEYLIGLGHTRLAFLGFKEITESWLQERFRGFLAAQQRRGLLPDFDEPLLIPGQQHSVRPEELTSVLKHELSGISGVMCANDMMAYCLLQAAKHAGRKVPKSLSLIGVDDAIEFREYELTTFMQPAHEMGRLVAQLLVERCKSPDKEPVVQKVPCPLIARGTTGLYSS